MALSYTYTEVPWEDRLIVACNGIKVTKESHIFGDDEYTRTPEFYISDNKLWDEFYFHIYKNCEVDLLPDVDFDLLGVLAQFSTYAQGATKRILELNEELKIALTNPAHEPEFNGVNQKATGFFALNEKAKALHERFEVVGKLFNKYKKSILPEIYPTETVEKADADWSTTEAQDMFKSWRIAQENVRKDLVSTVVQYFIRDFCVYRYSKRMDEIRSRSSLSAIRDAAQINSHDPYTLEQVNRLNTLFNITAKESMYGISPQRALRARHIFNAAINAGDWATADSIYGPLGKMEALTGGTDNDHFGYIWYLKKESIDKKTNSWFNDLSENTKNDMKVVWQELTDALEAGLEKYPTNEGLVLRPATKTLATVEDLVTYVNGYSMPHSETLLLNQQQQIVTEASSRETVRQSLDSVRTTMQREDTAKQAEASKNYVTTANSHADDTIKMMATKSALAPSEPETVMVPDDPSMEYTAETMAQLENTNGNETPMEEVPQEVLPTFPRNCGSHNVNSRAGMDTYANDTNVEYDFTGAAEEAYIMAKYNVEFGSEEYWEAYEAEYYPPEEEEKEPSTMDKIKAGLALGKDAAGKALSSVGNAAMKAGTSLTNTAGQLGSELLGAAGDTLGNLKDTIMNTSAESLLDKTMGVVKNLACDSDGNFSLGKAISSATMINNIIQTKDPANALTKLSSFTGKQLGMPGLSKAVSMAAKVKRNGFTVDNALGIGNTIGESLGLVGEGKDTLFNRISKDSLADASLIRGAMSAIKSGDPQRLGDFLSSSKVSNAYKNTNMPSILFNNLTPSTTGCSGLAKLANTFGFTPSANEDLSDKLGDSAIPPKLTDTEHQAVVDQLKSATIDARSYQSPGSDKKMVSLGMDIDEARMRSAIGSEFAVC